VPARPGALSSDAWTRIVGLDVNVGLRMVGGRVAVCQRVLRRFVEHHGGDAARLRANATDPGAAGDMATLCHTLKSVAGALAAQALAAQAAQLEAGLLASDGLGHRAMPISDRTAAQHALAATIDTLLAAIDTALPGTTA
jgi:HPt (histidine-containing phosphotransfer) domain-containing protein